MRTKLFTAAAAIALVGLTGASPAQAAPTTEVVTEGTVTRQAEDTTPTDNWVLYTRALTPPTAAAFVSGPASPPLGSGSLRLTTATSTEKVYLFNYDHVGTDLSAVDAISYSTFRQAGNAQQVTALNLQVDFNGTDAGGFTTLVFEPVYNTDQGPVANGSWQDWDAVNGGDARWWSTRPIPGVCAFDCFVAWEEILDANPAAEILGGVGVNQGSGNGGLIANVDAFTFGDVTYDFEGPDADGDGIPDTAPPTDKDQCKNDGWQAFNNPTFKNQGDCVSYVASNK
jgi:hypothetical protein